MCRLNSSGRFELVNQRRQPAGRNGARIAGYDQSAHILGVELQVVSTDFHAGRCDQIRQGSRAERKQTLIDRQRVPLLARFHFFCRRSGRRRCTRDAYAHREMHEFGFSYFRKLASRYSRILIVGAYRHVLVASTTSLGAHDERRVVRKFPPQPLRPSPFRRPARVIELRQAQIVQPCCPQSGTSELSSDDVAAITEDSLDSFGIEVLVNRAATAASHREHPH
jgi:hypothetical protein